MLRVFTVPLSFLHWPDIKLTLPGQNKNEIKNLKTATLFCDACLLFLTIHLNSLTPNYVWILKKKKRKHH